MGNVDGNGNGLDGGFSGPAHALQLRLSSSTAVAGSSLTCLRAIADSMLGSL